MTVLLTLLLAATLATGARSTASRPPPRPPARPIVVHITHPEHRWRDIGIGAAGGGGLVLFLLGASLLTRRNHANNWPAPTAIERRQP